jgi:hypothetical protein
MTFTPDEEKRIAKAEAAAAEAQRIFEAASPGSAEAFAAAPVAIHARREADQIRRECEYEASNRALK